MLRVPWRASMSLAWGTSLAPAPSPSPHPAILSRSSTSRKRPPPGWLPARRSTACSISDRQTRLARSTERPRAGCRWSKEPSSNAARSSSRTFSRRQTAGQLSEK
ncbi:hypothetical protein T484DRAFT_1918018, partial [Baffinella frigidus]